MLSRTLIIVIGLISIQLTSAYAAKGGEVGENDFRISEMGPDGVGYDAFAPAVAYNSINQEYLVVWWGDDGIAEGIQVYAQRFDAPTGDAIGIDDFRISSIGSKSDPSGVVLGVAVTFNETENEYLVVWAGEEDSPFQSFDIFGQRLDGATGNEVGENDFRISEMAGIASRPAVAYNSIDNAYIVVWQGNNAESWSNIREDIYGQHLDAMGIQLGEDDFKISDIEPDSSSDFGADRPAVVHNGTENEYLVIWRATEGIGEPPQAASEIQGQRLDAITGMEVGENDFPISGNVKDQRLGGGHYGSISDVGYSPRHHEYLVAWRGFVDSEISYEIFGQRLDADTGDEVGENDFRISDMGSASSQYYQAWSPRVVYNRSHDEFVVVWRGDDDTGILSASENEIFGQRIDAASGEEVGPDDYRLSDMGPDGDSSYDANPPDIAYNDLYGYLVVWGGDDDTAPLVDNEEEIFGQRIFIEPVPGYIIRFQAASVDQ